MPDGSNATVLFPKRPKVVRLITPRRAAPEPKPFLEVAPPEPPPRPALMAAGEVMGRLWGSDIWQAAGAGQPVDPNLLTFDRGLTLTGASVTLDYAGTTQPNIGGVFVTAHSATQGLLLGAGNGALTVPAATAALMGGVTVPARTDTQGLAINAAGNLTLPVAEEDLLGGILEAPDDGHTYVRGNNTWLASAMSEAFIGFENQHITGFEPVLGNVPTGGTQPPAGAPQYTFTVPADDLPIAPFNYVIEGSGLGHFFMTNKGLGAQTMSGNWHVCIEMPIGSGNWFQMGTYTGATLPAEDTLFRAAGSSQSTSANARIFHFDRATDAGIRFGIWLANGVNSGVPADMIFGVQGQILAINP